MIELIGAAWRSRAKLGLSHWQLRKATSMNNETITQNAWQQQMKAVENLRSQMEATPLGTANEDEIVDRFADARDALMQTPAPDLVAVQWKVVRLKEQGMDGLFVKADADAVISDISRLTVI